MSTRPGHLQATARAYLAALASMDEEALVSAFAPDAVAYVPAGSSPVRGRPAIREVVRSVFSAAQPLHVTGAVADIAGPTVAIGWAGRWRALGGELRFGGIDVFDVDPAGWITAWWAHWDRSVFVSGCEGRSSATDTMSAPDVALDNVTGAQRRHGAAGTSESASR